MNLINSVTPLFSQLPLQRLTRNDLSTPRAEIPPTQRTLSTYEKTPVPAREILMATALAYQGPIMARMLMQEDDNRNKAA